MVAANLKRCESDSMARTRHGISATEFRIILLAEVINLWFGKAKDFLPVIH